MRYHHLGIPTTRPQPGETYLAQFGMFCTDHEHNPFGIQWMRFEPGCPLPELVRTVPHVAFEVHELAEALMGHEGEVELTEEREAHIARTHPDLLPEYLAQIGQTLADPDQIQRSIRMSGARMFYRWFEDVRQGKHVVVVVVSGSAPRERHWVVTAYIARRLAQGEIEWHRH
jgi:hypothetical protein